MPDTNITAAPVDKKEKKEPVLREPGTPPSAETLKLLSEMKTELLRKGVFVENRWVPLEKAVQKSVELDKDLIDDTIKWFTDEKELDVKEDKFSISKHLVDLYSECPFFAEVSRWVRKVEAKTMRGGQPLPTAAMCYNLDTDDFELRFNKRWFASLTDEQVRNVLVHELYHLIWRHITSRRRSPNVAWNIATDLAINSIIVNSRKDHASVSKDVYKKYLPTRLYLPTVKPQMGDLKGATPEEKEVNEKYADLIEKLPELKASEGYFSTLLEFARQNGWEWGDKGIKLPNGTRAKKKSQGGGDGDSPVGMKGQQGDGSGEGETTDEVELDSGDVHDMWDDVPDEVRDLIEGKVKGIVERAVRRADNTSNGWGNIPSEIVGDIRASVLQIVDWKQVLKNFVGMQNRGSKSNTMKRINKRYPYIHPGTKRGYNPKVLMAVDQSGSVDDQSLESIFGVLRDCAKRTSFTVLPFDHTVDEKNMFEWKRGQTPKFKRVRSGGTSFQAVIDFINKPENRGKWDGIIFCTDGECYKPTGTYVRTAWVIVPGRKLMFETNDLVIQMDDNKSTIKKGSVR